MVFNALHGPIGEDGCVQGLLEIMGLPYTHSGVLASALAMDKPAAKRLFADAGITCPEGRIMRRADIAAGGAGDPPYVVKPLDQGSSVGVHLVFSGDNAVLLNGDWPYGEQVLVEPYIPGREIQVAVMGERALGAIEIRPKGRFYDYEAKYTEGRADHYMPAPIHPDAYEEALDIALTAHRTLGCRGVSRADLRYDDTAGEPGRFYLLEINTQPGMTPLSLVPEIAADVGISFEQPRLLARGERHMRQMSLFGEKKRDARRAPAPGRAPIRLAARAQAGGLRAGRRRCRRGGDLDHPAGNTPGRGR